MFKIGDNVLYGAEGVCRISEITEKQFGGTAIEYYILTPVFNSNSTFFVPTKNEKLTSKMHPLLNDNQIDDIIHNSTEMDKWIENDNERKDLFRDIISEGNLKRIASMLKSLIHHKSKAENAGKKFHKADEIILKEAQKIIYEEFAMVMDLQKDDVIGLLCNNGK